jgi:hypothetical protein
MGAVLILLVIAAVVAGVFYGVAKIILTLICGD